MVISVVNQIRYLGLIFNSDLTIKAHLTKRRQPAFAMLSRIDKLDFNNGSLKPHVMGNMFKTYIRLVIMYGVEILEPNGTETKSLCKLESLIPKIMMGIKQRC
jgi:hypothetical protein